MKLKRYGYEDTADVFNAEQVQQTADKACEGVDEINEIVISYD